MKKLSGHWLAGFADGEATFNIRREGKRRCYTTDMRIGLRDDDASILERCKRDFGIGTVYKVQRRPPSQNQVVWCVSSRDDCAKLVQLFDKFPLQAKKSKDYALWRAAVLTRLQIRSGGRAAYNVYNDALYSRLASLREELIEVRKYVARQKS